MLRVAIPIVLALASATILRTLLLPLIVSILAGIVLTVMQSQGRKRSNPDQTRKERDKVVDSSYRIVDDEPPK